MIGKVNINANGEKAISFDDAAWAGLPVGATIYAAGNGEVDREAVKAVGRTVLETIVEGLASGAAKHLAAEASGVIEKGIVEELERLRTDLAALEQACKEVLPGAYCMDPPDGGDVPLTEQVLRMGKDAARYRKWRHGACARIVETAKALCYAGTPEQIDQAIDSLNWEG